MSKEKTLEENRVCIRCGSPISSDRIYPICWKCRKKELHERYKRY